MSRFFRRLFHTGCGALLTGSLALAQQPIIPPVDVEAPRVQPIIPPIDVEGTAPPRGDSTGRGGPGQPNDGPNYSGSPFNDFNTRTGTLTGAPGDPFNAPRSTTILNQARIAEQAATNTPELLDNIPGVLLQRTNGAGGSLIIRGRNGNQNLIMVDGIPINDAGWRFANVQYLNTIDPGVIERIEVIKGPASVLYGSGATGGVVNIITKSRKDYSQSFGANGDIIANYSSALESPYGRGQISANFQNLGVLAGASYLNFGTLHAGQGVDFDESIVGYNQRAADLRLDWLLNEKWTATFDYQYLNQSDVPRTDRFPFAGVDPTRFTNQPTFVDPQRRDFGYLRLSGFDCDAPFLNGLQLTLHLQHRREIESELLLANTNNRGELTPLAVNARRQRINKEDVLNYGVDLRAFTYFSEDHTLTYGATYVRDELDTFRLQRQGQLSTQRTTFVTPSLPSDGTYEQFGLFVMDNLNLTEKLGLTGGLRYSNVRAQGTINELGTPRSRLDNTFDDLSAEGGVVYKVTENFHTYAAIQRGFRAPNLDDLASSDRSTGRGQDFGSANLKSERVVNYEAGVKVRNEIFGGQASYYYADYPSQIVRTTQRDAAGTNRQVRLNTEGFINGVEADGYVLLTDTFSLFAAGSYTFGNDETLNEPLSRINPAFAQIGGRWSYAGCGWNMFFEAWGEFMAEQDRLSTSDKADIRIPIGGEAAWQTFNLRGGFGTDNFGRLTLGVYNVFDQRYRYLGSGVDSVGLDLRVGYELSF